MHKKPLVGICVAVVVGILFANFSLRFISVGGWLIVAGVCWLGWWLAWRFRHRTAWIWLLASCLSLSGARYHDHWCNYAIDDMALLEIQAIAPVAVRCQVLTVPELSGLPKADPLATVPKGSYSAFYAKVFAIRNGQRWEAGSGRIQVRVDGHLLGVEVGDRVELYGHLSPLLAPMNPGEADRRLAERNRRTMCRLRVSHPDCARRLEQESSRLNFRSYLGHVRKTGLNLLDEHVDQNSLLASALLLGARDRVEQEQLDRFFHTGTIHLLAISGLHVGILAWLFFFLAKRTAGRRYVLVSLMCGAVVYCHLTGLRAPVLRAVVLVQIICLGAMWRRNISATNALAAAAILILAYRPGALFLPGAQLSFLAVTTLIWLQYQYQSVALAPIEKLVLRSRSLFQRVLDGWLHHLYQLLVASFAISVVTLPLVMHWFHLCAPISILLNLALSIPVVLALLSGFAVLCLGVCAEPLAAMAGLVCDWNLAFIDTLVRWAHELPCAYFWVGGPSALGCAVFYVGLALSFFLPKVRVTLLWVSAWLAVWVTVGTLGSMVVEAMKEPRLEATFLSIGHGTCVVLEMPDGRVVVYDAGRMGVPKFGTTVVSEFLWSRGIGHVDAIIVSHADADHYNLVPGLVQRFSIGQVFVSHRMFTAPSGGVATLQASIQEAKIPIVELRTNDVLPFGDANIRILHPQREGVVGSDNANSIVAEVSYQDRRILLPGDLENPGLADVLAELPRHSDVVMAPHHGSPRSAPAIFATWCSPNHVVISGGRKVPRDKAVGLFAINEREIYHTAFGWGYFRIDPRSTHPRRVVSR